MGKATNANFHRITFYESDKNRRKIQLRIEVIEMPSKLVPLFVIVFVCTISAAAQTLIEAESSIVFRDKTAELTLSIDAGGKPGSFSLELELLDATGTVRASASPVLKVRGGKQAYKVQVPVGNLVDSAGDEIVWYRLRYKIGVSTGVISLSELLKDDFELRVAAFERLVPGKVFRARVRTLHPLTQRPNRRVAIEGELELELDTDADEDELKLKARGLTNGDGLLVLDFKVPDNVKVNDANLIIRGSKGGVIREVDEDLDSDDQNGSVFLTSDKPLYQPGQSFSARGLYFDVNNVVVADAELEFTIEDEDDTVLYRQKVKTSDFGIAAISWTIPENAKLGNYRLRVEADDDLRADQLMFKVSRYDLPNFTVSVKPDKSYYLPGDSIAEIAVNADYLFGKPVNKGKVRVVQESDRQWNYVAQKYDVSEGPAVEGEADANGKFVAKIDLTDENAKLRSREWRKYEDIRFAAYFTDPSTNRTEQRRFEIRLTKEPIHIYLIRHDNHHPKLPLTAYVSTFYADGTPAVCDVEIKTGRDTLDRFRTNSLGAGKFGFSMPKEFEDNSYLGIQITARDKKGRQGNFNESFYLNRGKDALKLTTSKTIHKPGEPVDISIVSTQEKGYLYIDVVKDWTVVDSRIAVLHGGKASVSIPYRPEFKGELTVAAYNDQETYYWDSHMRSSRGIIYPEQQNLSLTAKFSNATYKPSEDAKVRFSVLDGRGLPAESALGIAVFDKAVEQRAKTDAEFGSYFGGFSSLMGYEKSFGSLSVKDLNDLDPSKPVSPEIELAAEVMLAGNYYYPHIYHGGGNESAVRDVFREYFSKQLKAVEEVLKSHFEKVHEFPNDDLSLRRIIEQNVIDPGRLKDPWGSDYYARFATEKTQATIQLRTKGPDKQAVTDDDFEVAAVSVPYFKHAGSAIDKAVADYHSRTGGFIRDLETLSAETLKRGLDLSKLKDRWNRDYRVHFEVAGRSYVIRFQTLGANGLDDYGSGHGDDFDIWKTNSDHFYKTENKINEILNTEVNSGKKPFPKNAPEFTAMLKSGGVDLAAIKDGYGRPVRLTYDYTTRYVDKSTYENGKQVIKPATDQLLVFSVMSEGENLASASDDADLAKFSSVVTEAYGFDPKSKAEVKNVAFTGGRGAISGTVLDANGAVIPGADVTATNENDASQAFVAKTDDNGYFLLSNLPSGRYSVRVESPNFAAMVHTEIEVRSQNLVEMKVTLEVGNVTSEVTVTAEAQSVVDSTSSSISRTVTKKSIGKISFPYKDQTSTPRLREYFPETLVWRPELLTDKKGRAEMSFKMADNITTWKMYAIASTKKGKIGVTENEIVAFQPFFVDLDPPKFLTEGDEIHLPTQVRNYTEKKQQVNVTMTKADWFSFLGSDKQRVEVESGNSNNSIFGFKAVSAIKDGKQRVTAIAQSDSDAIEKPVTVRPDGQEIVKTDSKVSTGSAAFEINFPTTALLRTQKAELKIYPNLFAHVTESVEGLLQRPYGCGEQTTSSTYPNLMIMKFVAADSPLRQKAEKYLHKGYERLLGYQVADGGFSYWGGKDQADVALTAYVLRFLNDAASEIDVDENVVSKAESWLIKQQRADGSWTRRYYYENSDDQRRAKLFTSYIARTLAMRKNSDKAALAKALDYLRARNAEIDEPYALALYGLASLDAGNKETASKIAAQLEKMAIDEAGAVYWRLETNTPFYGWGTAGRIETTALVLNLLIRDAAAAGAVTAARRSLIDKGTLFLIRSKDRYGVWYSTQTTINVLDAFLAALAKKAAGDQTLNISLNGEIVQTVTVPQDKIDPVIVDLTGKLNAASNRVEIRGTGESALMSQIVASHYIDWRDSEVSKVNIGNARALKFDYKCDRQTAAIMQEISCSVEAERVGYQGYGMLLAEIGTPPGADVSRESLQTAMDADWSLSRYDILPDRIVLYMWAKAGGTKFNFKFKPRYGINAQTPASVVYDYYNPEAQATAAPLRFLVK